ncbi:type II secretion system F family protein [Marinilactibacillus sp. XAAS-LB27]|uniref:type II secretion system F family protein n=1 Tax=Marinilactibacillus sp. XAAS-LB27 TaxID=3114538 RepID=UPI002E18D69A|nr:type II secretion system F family protein [Marinilactibacillus sp. XAAS-LB27]
MNYFMTMYAYKAKRNDGTLVKGKLESQDKKEALIELEQLNLIVYSIKELNSALYKDIYIGKPIKSKDFVLFLRQFSTLIDSGILLLDALEILSKQIDNKPLREALEQIALQIKEGISLSEAMRKYPKLFPNLLVNMIQSGEASGRLDDVLKRMADYYEKQHRLKQKVSTALTYPAVVGAMAIMITIFLLVFIVPIFADLFLSFGEELPAYTQFVLNLSETTQRYWWIIILSGILVVYIFKELTKRESTAFIIDGILLKVPVVGMFVQKSILARMTQTLSSLLNSSVPILEAVDITSNVMSNRVVKKVLLESKQSLERGESLSIPMKQHWMFPNLITQMITVGESSGALDEMLHKVAEVYDRELEEASDKLQSLIEPILIVFLSAIVGAIVLSIIIPMFSLFETF